MSAKEFRMDIGADILEAMQKANDLPLPNINILSKTMMEYFKQEGFVDDLKEAKYKWRPTADYWNRHIKEVASILATERNKPFCYCWEGEGFQGLWKFCTKSEYDMALRWEHAGISTRTDGYNQRLDESKWKIDLPHIAEVPLLSNN